MHHHFVEKRLVFLFYKIIVISISDNKITSTDAAKSQVQIHVFSLIRARTNYANIPQAMVSK